MRERMTPYPLGALLVAAAAVASCRKDLEVPPDVRDGHAFDCPN